MSNQTWWRPEQEGDEIEGVFDGFVSSGSGLGLSLQINNGASTINVGCGKVLQDKLRKCWRDLVPGQTEITVLYAGKVPLKSSDSRAVGLYRLWVDKQEVHGEREYGRVLGTSEVEAFFEEKSK